MNEQYKGDSSAHFSRADEIRKRLEQIDEIVDVLGEDDPKAKKAMSERGVLEKELNRAEVPEKKDAPQRVEPIMAPAEKSRLEQAEDFNQIIAQELGKLMRSNDLHPELKKVIPLLLKPQNVQSFIQDKIGTEFFTQHIRADAKAVQIVEDSLGLLYNRANERRLKQAA